MSETETRMGVAVEREFPEGSTWEQKVDALIAEGCNINRDEAVEDRYFEGDVFMAVGDRIFEITEDVDIGYDDLCHASMNPDGTVSYALKYYNGGTCFREMFEDAIKGMDGTS